MSDEDRWGIWEYDNGDIVVMPLDDIRPHDPRNRDCPCLPDVEVIGGRLKVIHNAFDFRHLAECLNAEANP
jgi:hypothetical protein